MMSLEQMRAASDHPVGDWIRSNFDSIVTQFIANAVVSSLIMLALAGISASLFIWLERKICAHFQARLGPMRVGPHGIFQSVADGIKLLLKEMLCPRGADKFIFYLAPFAPATASFLVLAVLPFDYNMQVVDLNIGVLYILAVSGFGVFGMLLGGWASNNKYSLLGGMRAGAQLISYEISVALGMLLIVALSGSASLREIVLSQYGTVLDWWVFKVPVVGFVAFVFFLISSTAELNRAPFDLPEAESELTAGFHTEYSGITFSMFFLAEFINMFIASALATTFFLGGFLAPQFGIAGLDSALAFIPGFLWFFIKTYLIVFVFMWFRWSFPRPRIDQLLNLEWKFLLPANLLLLALALLMVAGGWTL